MYDLTPRHIAVVSFLGNGQPVTLSLQSEGIVAQFQWLTDMGFLESIGSFLSVVVIAWITQRIITHWEKRKKIEETKLAIYMSWMPFIAECYARAAFPESQPDDPKEFLRRKMEILGILQIMGPLSAMEAFCNFCEMVEKGFKKDPSFDGDKFHRTFTALNHCLCCEIHDERQK